MATHHPLNNNNMDKINGILIKEIMLNIVAMVISLMFFIITGFMGSWFIACINIFPFIFNIWLFTYNYRKLPYYYKRKYFFKK